MAEIGKINKLTITHSVDFGVYLDAGDGSEILLPLRYVTGDMHPGDEVDVFVYLDSEDRPVATTEQPKAMVGDFAFLQVKAVNSIGAFLDWGLLKDLLVPFREQKVRMEPGRFYTVYVYLDDATGRIVASAKLDKFLDNKVPDLHPHDEAEIRIVRRTDLGYKVIVNGLYSGLIYHNEIFTEVNIGEIHPAIVKAVRRDDKIDLILGKHVKSRVEEIADSIMAHLATAKGTMAINDSSSPEEIKATFACSKKDFKKAIGLLYKKKRIKLSTEGITAL